MQAVGPHQLAGRPSAAAAPLPWYARHVTSNPTRCRQARTARGQPARPRLLSAHDGNGFVFQRLHVHRRARRFSPVKRGR